MRERQASQQFQEEISRLPITQLQRGLPEYRSVRNSGIRRLSIGAAAAVGAIGTAFLIKGEAGLILSMGQILAGAASSVSGVPRLGRGRLAEKFVAKEIARRQYSGSPVIETPGFECWRRRP